MPGGRSHYKLTLRDALEAHEVALETGGVPGILDLNLVASNIGRPYSGYYRQIWKKAAALFEAGCRNHGFADANKRTALLNLHTLLDRSGYSLEGLEGEDIEQAVEDLAVAIADENQVVTYDEIAVWMRARIVKVPAE